MLQAIDPVLKQVFEKEGKNWDSKMNEYEYEENVGFLKTNEQKLATPNIPVKWVKGILKSLNPYNKKSRNYVGIGVLYRKRPADPIQFPPWIKDYIDSHDHLGYYDFNNFCENLNDSHDKDRSVYSKSLNDHICGCGNDSGIDIKSNKSQEIKGTTRHASDGNKLRNMVNKHFNANDKRDHKYIGDDSIKSRDGNMRDELH